MEEQLRVDKQELKLWEQRKNAKDAKRMRGTVHEIDKSKKEQNHVQDELEKFMHHNQQALLKLVGKGGIGMTPKVDGLVLSFVPRPDVRRVEYILRHKMYTRVPRETCLRQTVKAPIKARWVKTDKGSPTCARGGSRRNLRHSQDQSCMCRPPPLDALKVVLAEVAEGKRGGNVVAHVDVRRAYFYAPSRRRAFVESPPEDYKAHTHVRAVCNTACTASVTLHKMVRKNLRRHAATSSGREVRSHAHACGKVHQG